MPSPCASPNDPIVSKVCSLSPRNLQSHMSVKAKKGSSVLTEPQISRVQTSWNFPSLSHFHVCIKSPELGCRDPGTFHLGCCPHPFSPRWFITRSTFQQGEESEGSRRMRDTNLSPQRPRHGTYHFSTSSIYRNESSDPLMMQEILGNGVFN